MNKTKITPILVNELKSGYGKTYDIYVEYCKAKGIQQEIFRCDYEGINALYDNPAQAVYAFANADLKPTDCEGMWDFIYLNDSLRLCYCDDISEKVDLNPVVEWIFTLEDYERVEMFYILDDMDVSYAICEEICKGESTHFVDQFTLWLDDNDEYNLATLLAEDWTNLLARYKASLS